MNSLLWVRPQVVRAGYKDNTVFALNILLGIYEIVIELLLANSVPYFYIYGYLIFVQVCYMLNIWLLLCHWWHSVTSMLTHLVLPLLFEILSDELSFTYFLWSDDADSYGQTVLVHFEKVVYCWYGWLCKTYCLSVKFQRRRTAGIATSISSRAYFNINIGISM
jgi:hypothetical protein